MKVRGERRRKTGKLNGEMNTAHSYKHKNITLNLELQPAEMKKKINVKLVSFELKRIYRASFYTMDSAILNRKNSY